MFGKEDTLITIQIDQMLSEKFGMEYVDRDGQKKNPYIIHRTSIGCYERTLALILEKYAGALPVWLAPEQVKVLPVSNLFEDYAYDVLAQLKAAGIRAEIDNRNEKIGYRIREAQLSKVPYMVIVGANEEENKNISVRSRKEAENKVMGVDEFTAQLKYEIENFVK